MKDEFYRIDGDDNFVSLTDEEIKIVVEGVFGSDEDDNNEELPPLPEEIFIDMSKIK